MSAKTNQMDMDLSVVGNCAYSALIDRKAQVVWSCFPRFDGDPIFCSLLKRSSTYSNDIGFFDIYLPNLDKTEQSYIRNTAVLSTKLWSNGNCLEVIDCIPRFEAYDRDYRPNMLIRIVRPIKGRPRAQIRLRPTFGYGWGTPEKTRGSNHIRYLLSNMTIRLTTNAPISYIVDEVLFEIEEPLYLVLMPDESLKAPLSELTDNYLQKTINYWTGWTRTLSIPFEWQDQVLRACITLKTSHFEETGAFVAALTTSIPDKTSGASHDYRYCWLRDALGVVTALNELGATASLESYLSYLSNIVADFTELHGKEDQKRLQSVYGISLETRLYEREMHRLPGYRGMGPVRLGTKDAEADQHDVYGVIILALTQLFFDRRLKNQGDEMLYDKLQILGEMALRVYNTPDFGPRRSEKAAIHTASSAMCWAACDRLAKIALQLKKDERATYWKTAADKIHDEVSKKAWHEESQSFVSVWEESRVDPWLLLLPEIGFIKATDPKFVSTIKRIEKDLLKGKKIVLSPEDSVANNRATFWYISTIASMGREDEARDLFSNMLSTLNHNGMLSETCDVQTGELWGNFPHGGSMVGLIHCAVRLSKPWKHLQDRLV